MRRQCKETEFTWGEPCPRCHKPTRAKGPFPSWRTYRRSLPDAVIFSNIPRRWTPAQQAARERRYAPNAATASSALRQAAGERPIVSAGVATTGRAPYRRKGPEPAPLLSAE